MDDEVRYYKYITKKLVWTFKREINGTDEEKEIERLRLIAEKKRISEEQ